LEIRIGISGWTYAPWRGVFYPPDLPQKSELHYASRKLSSIEINGTFYSLQRPSSYANWYEQTPADFVFSLKAGRFITHILRLRNAEAAIANFFLSGPLRLNEKLGPILWQFPPSFSFEPDTFETFLGGLPRTTSEAAKLLKGADDKIRGRSWAEIDRDRPMRHAVEIRHPSFANESFVRLLRKHGIALVIADTAGKWPMLQDITADFLYVRLHGAEELYASGYTEDALDAWAKKIRGWSKGKDSPTSERLGPPAGKSKGRDTFIYFDNDVKVNAPFDAAKLAMKLGSARSPLEKLGKLNKARTVRHGWPHLRRPGRVTSPRPPR
jgi:uncharacterized protein YecE (DUF72 family)